MQLGWLANTSQDRIVGDYISTSMLAAGDAWPTVAVAISSGGVVDKAMHVSIGGLAGSGGARRASSVGVSSPGRHQPQSGTAIVRQ
jgi:hypothetical protein